MGIITAIPPIEAKAANRFRPDSPTEISIMEERSQIIVSKTHGVPLLLTSPSFEGNTRSLHSASKDLVPHMYVAFIVVAIASIGPPNAKT